MTTPNALYRHYKTGQLYYALAVSEDGNKEKTSQYVTYFAVNDPTKLFTRSEAEFSELIDGIPRFELVPTPRNKLDRLLDAFMASCSIIDEADLL